MKSMSQQFMTEIWSALIHGTCTHCKLCELQNYLLYLFYMQCIVNYQKHQSHIMYSNLMNGTSPSPGAKEAGLDVEILWGVKSDVHFLKHFLFTFSPPIIPNRGESLPWVYPTTRKYQEKAVWLLLLST